MVNKSQVAEMLASVAPLYANYKPPSDTHDRLALVNAWHMMIGHLALEVLQAAFRVAVGRSEFYPTPATVLEAAVELTTTPKRTGLEAWGDVKAAISAHGYYHGPDGSSRFPGDEWSFDDPLVRQVVKAMGWEYLCMSEDEMADRAHFQKAYETMRTRADYTARLSPDVAQLGPRREQAAQLAAAVSEAMKR